MGIKTFHSLHIGVEFNAVAEAPLRAVAEGIGLQNEQNLVAEATIFALIRTLIAVHQRLFVSRRVLLVAAGFSIALLVLQAWRSWVLLATYDQGIFQQVLWNSLHGHWFESTLSSQLSTNVIHDGALPSIGYARLGQHFTPTLLIWAPFVGLIGGSALPLVQVGLITAAGLVLYRLAHQLVPERTANWITYGYFAGNALIGPTLGNFTDLCQLPLAVFSLVLGLQEKRRWLVALSALLIPLIREDTGILLVAIGAWLAVREPQRWPLALAFVAWGGGWLMVCTNLLMPLFSDDNAKRFMVENFGQYLGDNKATGTSSLGTLQQVLSQPLLLLQQLVDPPGQTLLYLLGQGLPFLFIPLISLDTVLLAGPSLLGLFLAQGANDPLSITIRYTLLVVPGFALGALFWWVRRPNPNLGSNVRLAWGCALTLSLLLTVSSNPHRSLSALIPDSIDPWVHSGWSDQWAHGKAARQALQVIPEQASVAANTPLIPLLARRQIVVRFPFSTDYQDREGTIKPVDWIAVDLDFLNRYGEAFRGDWKQLRNSKRWVDNNRDDYSVRALIDGVVVMERTTNREAGRNWQLENALNQHLAAPLPKDPKRRSKP